MSKWSNKEDRVKEIARIYEVRKGLDCNSAEYIRLSRKAQYLKQYERNLELKRKVNARYRQKYRALHPLPPKPPKEEKPKNLRHLTEVERIMLEYSRPPFDFTPNEKTKFDIQEKELNKCARCNETITDHCYTSLAEPDKRYCEKCKDKINEKLFRSVL